MYKTAKVSGIYYACYSLIFGKIWNILKTGCTNSKSVWNVLFLLFPCLVLGVQFVLQEEMYCSTYLLDTLVDDIGAVSSSSWTYPTIDVCL